MAEASLPGNPKKNGKPPTQTMPRSGHVSNVRKKLMTYEDFSIASGLQEKEFEEHYDHNRQERRLVGGDTRVSKEEQKLEDVYAAEYWEQVRRDREREDEALARQIQEQLELEEKRKLQEVANHDSKLAARLLEYEKQRSERERENIQELSAEDERIAAEIQAYLSGDGAGGQPPSGLKEDTWAAYKIARREGRAIRLPTGISPEQKAAIEQALREEDRRIAQEIQDRELAKYLQRQESKRMTQEQVDNELNQASTRIKPSKPSDGNLINLDDEPPKPIIQAGYSAGSSSNPFLEDTSAKNLSPIPESRPPRPPPPKVRAPSYDRTLEFPANHRASCNPFESDHSPPTSIPPPQRRDIASMGGVRVLPPTNGLKK